MNSNNKPYFNFKKADPFQQPLYNEQVSNYFLVSNYSWLSRSNIHRKLK